MKSEFLLAFNQICSDRNLSREVVLDALRAALVSAYRRNLDASAPENVTANIDLETGEAQIFVEKQVVETVTDPEAEILLANARKLDRSAKVGDLLLVESTPKDFGRIAAQNAKQIILQRIREAEREAQYEHFAQQEGEIVHGTVHSIKPQGITLHLGSAEAILPRNQQVPGERYTLHQRVRAYVMEVRKSGRGPQITVSRSHKNMLRRLLELEVPEIFNGAVEIKSIAREAGSRSKVAVAARQAGVDPVGACVGMRGVRIQSIVNELGGEKIDVIEWDPDATTFIAKALSPAKVLSVHLDDDPIEGKTANVAVPDDQLSLAIGRAGQNARLAAKLTGWRIDIQSVTEAGRWALQQVNEDPNVLPALGLAAELLPAVANSLHRHEAESLPYNGEELLATRQVVEGVRRYYASLRNAERARMIAEETARRAALAEAEAERRAVIMAARARIPEAAYNIALSDLGLSNRVLDHLKRAQLETIGNVLERLAEGDEGLLRLEGFGPRSLAEVKDAIAALALPIEEEAVEEIQPEAAQAAAEATASEVSAQAEVAEPTEESPSIAVAEEAAGEAEAPVEAMPVAGETEKGAEHSEETLEEVAAPAPEAEVSPVVGIEETVPATFVFDDTELEEDESEESGSSKGKRKQDRRKRRQLVLDESTGTLVARRQHKRGGQGKDWEDF